MYSLSERRRRLMKNSPASNTARPADLPCETCSISFCARETSLAMARSACNTAVSVEDFECASFSRIRARTAAIERLICPSSKSRSAMARSLKALGSVNPVSSITLPWPIPLLTEDPMQHFTSAIWRTRGSTPPPEIALTVRGTSKPGRTCSIKRRRVACAACSSAPLIRTIQRSLCLTSAEMIARTLFRLATEPVRRFVKKHSEVNSFAASAKWLAGRACKPADKEHTNANSSDALALCVISGLELCENAMGILQRFLQWYLNYFDSIKSFALFYCNVDGKNCELGLADIVLCQPVFDAHGTLGLDFDFIAESFGHLFQPSGRHISVGNAGWASGDRDDLHATSSSLPFVELLFRALSRLIRRAVTIVPVTIDKTYISL